MSDPNLLNCLRKRRTIFIFAADIVPTNEPQYQDIGWRSTRGLEADKTGPVFSYERVQAAAALYRMNPKLRFVPSGGQTNTDAEGSPSIASIVSTELRMLGVPGTSIFLESEALNTWQQVTKCSELARLMGWEARNCGILAPMWQMSRIVAMIAKGENTTPLSATTTALISMERALAAEDDKYWNTYFREQYSSPEFLVTLASEAMGTGQLWSGHQPKYPNPFRGFEDPLKWI